jgi:hypothetical protein
MPGGREISLFSGYNQKENRHTNYCLLLLKQLYEANPRFLSEALDGITGGEGDSIIGVQFRQQEKHENTIPDGVIKQQPFTLFIETKDSDWFYDEQLENHLDALDEKYPGQKVLVALSKFPDGHEGRFENVEELCRERYNGRVVFSALSFEEFLEAVRVEGLPKNLKDTVDELETYMDSENLLPDWKYKLDLCNCASDIEEQYEHKVYICPATGGSYSHKRCRYFGAYKNKQAQVVAEILGVVDLDSKDPSEANVRWRNSEELTDEELIEMAIERKYASRPSRTENARVFVLGELHDTNFRKDSKGGMITSKQYFDVDGLDVDNAAQLAEALDGMVWSELN